MEQESKGDRIAKHLSHAGVCSRREAERMIAAGRVAVDGNVLETPAFLVTGAETITVDGKPIGGVQETRLFRYYKPSGLVTTHKDEKGRKTVFEALLDGMPRVVSVGRLDLNTEGLLLLTTDGGLARHLELPSTGWARRYRVRVFGTVDQNMLDGLAKGVSVDGVHYEPIEAVFEKQQGSNAWVSMTLREGKNREIRRVMEHLGLQVNRLIRLSFGPFQLGKMKEGAVEEVKKKVMKEQIADFFKGKAK